MSHTTPAETDRLTRASLDRAGERYLAIASASDLPPITLSGAQYGVSDTVLAYDTEEGWLLAYHLLTPTGDGKWVADIRGFDSTGEVENRDLTITHWLPLPPIPEGAPQ